MLKIISVLQCLLEPSKIKFLANMARFCSPRWLQVGPKIGSKSLPEPTSLRILILNRVWTDFGSILDRFWTDFGPILDRFWIDFWLILKLFFAVDVDVIADVVVNDVTVYYALTLTDAILV